ncbi:MAG TPA: OmpH family outer membrane protein [Candidatus Acidoferrales bacterium]|nr:OmpH family outer membrane protein [Candidatus Acidoferrales bacterium]
MKTRNMVFAGLAALLAAPSIWAQADAKAAAPPPSKIAVISLQAAILGTAEGKQASEAIRAQFAPRTTELQGLQKQIEDIQRQAQTGTNTLSEEAKARLQQQYTTLSRRYQRESQDLQDDGNDANQAAVNKIGQKMMTVLDKFAKANGYGVVIDESAQNTPVVYAANQVDITQQIIKLYDDAYPVKTASPAPAKPGASKPSSQN